MLTSAILASSCCLVNSPLLKLGLGLGKNLTGLGEGDCVLNFVGLGAGVVTFEAVETGLGDRLALAELVGLAEGEGVGLERGLGVGESDGPGETIGGLTRPAPVSAGLGSLVETGLGEGLNESRAIIGEGEGLISSPLKIGGTPGMVTTPERPA